MVGRVARFLTLKVLYLFEQVPRFAVHLADGMAHLRGAVVAVGAGVKVVVGIEGHGRVCLVSGGRVSDSASRFVLCSVVFMSVYRPK